MHTLAFEIDYAHEHHGWINCWLTINGKRHSLLASGTFPPFMPMLRFVRDVASQRLPSAIYFNEEDYGIYFAATALAEDSPLAHLVITQYGQPTEEEDDEGYEGKDKVIVLLDADIERETIVQAFLPHLLEMSENYQDPPMWISMPRKEVIQIQQSIVQGMPLRSDIHSPQLVDFSLRADYENESSEGFVSLKLWLNNEDRFVFLSPDTSSFWPQLIGFFEQVAGGILPAECEHEMNTTTLNMFLTAIVDLHRVTRFRAEPVDDPNNFRLRITSRQQDQADYLILDEVVDRNKFVHGFADCFSQFLRKDYQMRPDRDGNTFDLRTLSLDKLV